MKRNNTFNFSIYRPNEYATFQQNEIVQIKFQDVLFDGQFSTLVQIKDITKLIRSKQ